MSSIGCAVDMGLCRQRDLDTSADMVRGDHSSSAVVIPQYISAFFVLHQHHLETYNCVLRRIAIQDD
ncbi:hypothetical protein VTL71DRAFT_13037 [Oculimacula yallundae]|uniref:Uncharacterized protein n=1 Tax=Oculimacula yallundae TaxID=86028 RepID=A0ABR4CPU3_9HELO